MKHAIQFFRVVDKWRRKGPRVVAAISTADYPANGPLRYLWAGGRKWTSFTAFDLSATPPTLIRRDYAIEELRKLGAQLPPLYTDELGNIRNERDEIVMAGPERGSD